MKAVKISVQTPSGVVSSTLKLVDPVVGVYEYPTPDVGVLLTSTSVTVSAAGTKPAEIVGLLVALDEGESIWMEPYLQIGPPMPFEGGTVRVVVQEGPHPILKGVSDPNDPLRPFMLRPGHRIDLRIVSPARPDPLPPYAGPLKGDPNAIIAGEALDVRSDRIEWVKFGPGAVFSYAPPFETPSGARLLDFWRVGAGSPDYTLDDWILTRFGNPSRIPVLGLHNFGRVPWGDVDCNHHYDIIGCCLSLFLRTGDSSAWLAASVLAWRHLQTGVRFGCAISGDDVGRHDYEKAAGQPGNNSYTGSGAEPIETHAWDAGLAAFAFLSGDFMAHEWALKRASWLATLPPASTFLWQGAGGSRWIGWYARNCRAMMTLGYWPYPAEVRKTFVKNYVKHVLAKKNAAGTAWLPNAYTPKGFKPWMDAIAYVELIRLMDHVGIPRNDLDYAAVISGAVWLITNAVDPLTGFAPYEVIDFLDRTKDNKNYPETITGWLLPLATLLVAHEGLAPAVADQIRQNLLGWLDVTSGGAGAGGSAAVKTWAGAMWALQGADVVGNVP